MPTNFVLLQGRFEITKVQDVEVTRGKHSEAMRQVDGFVHVAAPGVGRSTPSAARRFRRACCGGMDAPTE